MMPSPLSHAGQGQFQDIFIAPNGNPMFSKQSLRMPSFPEPLAAVPLLPVSPDLSGFFN